MSSSRVTDRFISHDLVAADSGYLALIKTFHSFFFFDYSVWFCFSSHLICQNVATLQGTIDEKKLKYIIKSKFQPSNSLVNEIDDD